MRRGANQPRRHVQSGGITGVEQQQQGVREELPPLSSVGALARRPPAQQQHTGTKASKPARPPHDFVKTPEHTSKSKTTIG